MEISKHVNCFGFKMKKETGRNVWQEFLTINILNWCYFQICAFISEISPRKCYVAYVMCKEAHATVSDQICQCRTYSIGMATAD